MSAIQRNTVLALEIQVQALRAQLNVHKRLNEELLKQIDDMRKQLKANGQSNSGTFSYPSIEGISGGKEEGVAVGKEVPTQ